MNSDPKIEFLSKRTIASLRHMNLARQREWAEAQRRCPLSAEALAMAKELGIAPHSLIKNIPRASERWKAPVEAWVRTLHQKRFGARRVPPVPAPAPLIDKAPCVPVAPADAADADGDLEMAPGTSREEMLSDEITSETSYEEMGIWEQSAPVSGGEIADQDRLLLRRRDAFRRCAELFAKVAARLDFVQRVVLFGSVAAPLIKEVPRFSRLRRARIAVWHECKEVDVAVWVSDFTRLRELKRAVADATNLWQAIAHHECLPGVAHHQVDVFLMEPGTDRFRGNLCHFGQCPKGKPECEIAGCGASPFLRLYEDFDFNPRAPFGEHAVVLFDRDSAGAVT